jgi:iron complex outermembrane receptor protein
MEAGLTFKPFLSIPAELKSSYSIISGQIATRQYLPFIPAQRLNGDIRYSLNRGKTIPEFYITAGYNYVFAQTLVGQFETPTPAYHLINAGAGGKLRLKKERYLEMSLSANNLLNELYYDHLSRLKYFGVYNIGRNISLSIKFNF